MKIVHMDKDDDVYVFYPSKLEYIYENFAPPIIVILGTVFFFLLGMW